MLLASRSDFWELQFYGQQHKGQALKMQALGSSRGKEHSYKEHKSCRARSEGGGSQ